MELSPIYIISQIITVVYYGLLSSSYLLKDRIKILTANFIAHIGQVIAMALLNGYTGAGMAVIMIIRDLTLLIQEKRKSKEKDTNTKFDLIILIITVILIVVFTIFTYNGPLSLLSVIATLISTISLWQKNTKVYKVLGFIVALLWLSYNIFIMSIMGIILETILIFFTIIGSIKEHRSNLN